VIIEQNANNLIGNPAVLKQVNMVRILHRLRFCGRTSRAQLARETGLDAKTITNLCNSLLSDGLVESVRVAANGRGRPAEQLSINTCAAYGIGVDVGAQQVTALVIDLQGNTLASWHEGYGLAKSKDFLLKKVYVAVTKLLSDMSERRRKRIKGIGIGIPGFLKRKEGIVIQSVNIAGFKDVAIVDIIEKKFGFVVSLEESSRAMARGEIWFGGKSAPGNFICIDLGYGIGMGIVQNGLLYCGSNEISGEIGHTVVQPRGQECRCGKRGCLETIASGKALGELAEKLETARYSIKTKGAKAVYEAAVSGDIRAKKALRKAGHYIGIAIANAINLLDPESVILGGGLVRAGSLLVDPVREAVKEHSIGRFNTSCDIEISSLGEYGGALGLAMLPLRRYFEFENIRFS